jgi:hypothetical protein
MSSTLLQQYLFLTISCAHHRSRPAPPTSKPSSTSPTNLAAGQRASERSLGLDPAALVRRPALHLSTRAATPGPPPSTASPPSSRPPARLGRRLSSCSNFFRSRFRLDRRATDGCSRALISFGCFPGALLCASLSLASPGFRARLQVFSPR